MILQKAQNILPVFRVISRNAAGDEARFAGYGKDDGKGSYQVKKQLLKQRNFCFVNLAGWEQIILFLQ